MAEFKMKTIQIRNIDAYTAWAFKAYASHHGVTLAEALKPMLDHQMGSEGLIIEPTRETLNDMFE